MNLFNKGTVLNWFISGVLLMLIAALLFIG